MIYQILYDIFLSTNFCIKRSNKAHRTFVSISRFGNSAVETVYSQKHRAAYLEPEDSIWMIINLNLALKIRQSKNESTNVEFLQSSVNDNCLLMVLITAYKLFKFIHGTLENAEKSIIEKFFSRFVANINFYEKLSFLYSFGSIPSSPITNSLNLFFPSFGARANVKYCVYMKSDGSVLWSDLKCDHKITVYKYLKETQLTSSHKNPSQLKQSSGLNKMYSSGFMTLPSCFSTNNDVFSPPLVYLDDCKFYLIIYKYEEKIFFLFLPFEMEAQYLSSISFYQNIDIQIKTSFKTIGTEIGSTVEPKIPSQYKYIYYDEVSFAVKVSEGLSITQEVSHNLLDIKGYLQSR